MFDPLFLHYLDITILIFYKENTVQLSLWGEGLTGQIKLARQRRALGFLVLYDLMSKDLNRFSTHLPPSLRNVTVARGTREALPLHLFPDASTPVKEAVANFTHSVCRVVTPPMLEASPPQEFAIRRSERLAKKS